MQIDCGVQVYILIQTCVRCFVLSELSQFSLVVCVLWCKQVLFVFLSGLGDGTDDSLEYLCGCHHGMKLHHVTYIIVMCGL